MREMKDSGIEWVGKIPVSWNIVRMKNCISSHCSGAWGIDAQNNSNDIVCLRIADFDYKSLSFKNSDDLTIRNYNKQLIQKLRLAKGDILIEKSGGGEKTPVGRAVMFDKEYQALFANFMERIRVTQKSDSRYFLYILNAFYENRYVLNYIKQTIGIQNIDLSSLFSSEKIPFPPLPEQRAIAAYLDEQCTEINALSADIQSEIKTLEAYKKSVITEAVTKGLDKNVKMKDSGIEWVGDIPVTWKTMKSKYVFEQKSERGNIKSLVLLSPTQNYGVIPQDLYEELSGFKAVKLNENTDYNLLKTVHKGAFVISLRSFQGGFEYSTYEGVVSPAYQVFYPVFDIADGYYKYLFKTIGFIEKINSYTMSLRDGKNIAFADFGRTYIPIPPISEQRDIAAYLDEQSAEIESIIAQKQEQLSTLESYKKSLIYEYVTGKKEVHSV